MRTPRFVVIALSLSSLLTLGGCTGSETQVLFAVHLDSDVDSDDVFELVAMFDAVSAEEDFPGARVGPVSLGVQRPNTFDFAFTTDLHSCQLTGISRFKVWRVPIAESATCTGEFEGFACLERLVRGREPAINTAIIPEDSELASPNGLPFGGKCVSSDQPFVRDLFENGLDE